MGDNYRESAARHYADALQLKNIGRLDNAGHLVGFSAECAIKYGIESLRPSATAPQVHFPELLAVARKRLHGTRSALCNLLVNDLLVGWDVNRRYEKDDQTSVDEVEKWFRDAKRVLGAAGVRK